ncbi:MAG: hypothetical protein LQ350_003628 [Teloschistes chrysophthalmus]|nr:MAG: hypothetical protein LQ350_003628 [Niorma chrysophthalma]
MYAPTNPPTPSLFLKLPPEVRVVIYKWYFLQAPEHPTDACSQTSICETCVPGLGCDNASFNGGVPVGNLLAVAQCIYREVAPLYTRLHHREFEDIEDMRRYLSNLGPRLRLHIRSVKLLHRNSWNLLASTAKEAFRLLGECRNLERLDVTFYAHHLCCRRSPPKALQTLLQVRNITDLRINYRDISYFPLRYQPRDPPGTAEFVQTQQDLTSRLQILCTASTPQENCRREAADQGFGIIGGRRMFSLPEAN